MNERRRKFFSGALGVFALFALFSGFSLCSWTLYSWNARLGAAAEGEHWAFRPPVVAELPAVSDAEWPRNAIDHFILARLDALGRKPAPEADRYTLIRRLSLDLTGLPPTVEEVDTFIEDDAPGAYERLVDRLLASPSYGEHRALRWLDAVRYADTNGYETDRARSMWAYRDWVIDAFNADMPFDRFTVEQVAGDMLPGATLPQRVATGSHRNTWINEEGGHDCEQFRFESIVDRVNTTSTVFLGLTLACVQCHTHKYDPIDHEEYWRFFAFLNNVDEPFLDVPDRDVVEKRREILAETAKLEATREPTFPLGDSDRTVVETVDRKFEVWHRAEAAKTQRWTTLQP